MDESKNKRGGLSPIVKIFIVFFGSNVMFILLFFLMITVILVALGIIDFDSVFDPGSSLPPSYVDPGSSSSSNYVDPSYAYCDSINVEGVVYPLEEYIAGVLDAEVDIFFNVSGSSEALKAMSIAARTYAIRYTNGCKNSIPGNSSAQAFDSTPSAKAREIANSTAGLIMTYNNNVFLSEYDSFCTRCSDLNINSDGSLTVTYTRSPNKEKHSITLSDETYLKRIINDIPRGHGRGLSQYVALQYSKEGIDYQEILNAFYSDGIKISSLRSLQVGTVGTGQGADFIGTYTNAKTGKTYKNFKQYLYKSDKFTFEGHDHLASVGCGTNSVAIILSGENSFITPASLYIENNYTVGTYFGNYYPYAKDNFRYCDEWNDGYCEKTNNNTKIKNNEMKEKLISNLSNGGTAILFVNYSVDKCLINGKSWTGSQHFFTALDYNNVNNTIYISNPGTNDDWRNGWIPIDYFDCVHVAWLLYPE